MDSTESGQDRSKGPDDTPSAALPFAPGRRARWIAVSVTAYGLLVFAASSADLVRGEAVPLVLTFDLVHLLVVIGLAIGLSGRHRWAWWLTCGLAAFELFFFLPLAGSVLLGAGNVADSWVDAGFWVVGTGLLIVILGLLFASRRIYS